jgi:phosphoribosylaminoimidazole carboxylase (NCAIR synthetase)
MSFALLEKAGIPIPRYRVCETPEEVEKSAADLGLFLIIDMNNRCLAACPFTYCSTCFT